MKRYLLLILTLILPLFAQDVKSDRQVKLEKMLMSPCCFGGAIYDHESQVAFQMKNEIATMITQGKNDEQILAYYENKYGEKILASPKAQGFNLAAWVVPAVIGLLALILYVFYTFQLRNRSAAAVSSSHTATKKNNSSPAPKNSKDDVNAIIEKELDELRKNNS